jgi:hypothetical protein
MRVESSVVREDPNPACNVVKSLCELTMYKFVADEDLSDLCNAAHGLGGSPDNHPASTSGVPSDCRTVCLVRGCLNSIWNPKNFLIFVHACSAIQIL